MSECVPCALSGGGAAQARVFIVSLSEDHANLFFPVGGLGISDHGRDGREWDSGVRKVESFLRKRRIGRVGGAFHTCLQLKGTSPITRGI
ncbi:hypothetical protein GCM10027287_17110 [Bordetella muralis]